MVGGLCGRDMHGGGHAWQGGMCGGEGPLLLKLN